MTNITRPIRSETAVWVGDRYKSRGTLLLYPDRLVHAGSQRRAWDGPLGLVTTAVADAIDERQAPKKVAAGGAGVAAIPLDSITSVENLKARGIGGVLGGRLLVVITSERIAYKFETTLDYWIAELANALAARGHHVLPTPDGLTVASVPAG